MLDLMNSCQSYPVDSCGQTQIKKPTLSESLHNKKAALELELSKIEAAIKAVEKNPEIQEVLDVLSKL